MLIAINVLADRFVLRLPVDAVYIAALDNMIRWLMQWKMRLLAVGFFNGMSTTSKESASSKESNLNSDQLAPVLRVDVRR